MSKKASAAKDAKNPKSSETAKEENQEKVARKPAKKSGTRHATAEEMGAQQRSISVAEFFTKNRHLLGFDNPRRALLTTVKEAVDNSLDACEEAGILPAVEIKIEAAPNGDGKMPETPAQATRFNVTIIDNGPGIVKSQVPRIFAKLLYGSKFHRLRMSRGQQGIGISAAGMYGQLTTGKPTVVVSKTKKDQLAHYFEITIDTKRNEPNVLEGRQIEWNREHGTQVTIQLEGRYQRGRSSVDEYLEQTAVANPHVEIVYRGPDGNTVNYPRGTAEMPIQPREIKPHPYGIELGMLGKMLKDTSSRWLSGFLSSDFVRVSPRVAKEICERAGLSPNSPPRNIFGEKVEKLFDAIQKTKLMSPPTDCLSPIGEKAILAGLYKQIEGDFYTAVSRPPAVYRGNPFVIEAGLAFGSGRTRPSAIDAPLDNDNGNGLAKAEGEAEADKEVQLARVIRYANRVPLLHQQSSCCVNKAVLDASWRNYGLSQSRGALPQGPLVIFVHMASVWVPFTSEAKEAIADYDEIRKEIRLALCEAGRRLGAFIRKREHARSEFKRRNVFQLYIGEVVAACNRIKSGKLNTERLLKQLQKTAKEKTGGELTDTLVKKNKEQEAETENTIIVTEDGPQGDVPVPPTEAVSAPPSMDTLAPPSAATERPAKERKATPVAVEGKTRAAAGTASGVVLSRRKPIGAKTRAAASGKTKTLF